MTEKEKIYELVKAIPSGKVTTYGELAAALGNKYLARVVGNILHNNPDPANIPCHRVVNAKGKLAKHFAFGGAEGQRKRLENEGIIFENNGRIDLRKYGINP
jgi:O-6-methylguanine DNA methyltransferase